MAVVYFPKQSRDAMANFLDRLTTRILYLVVKKKKYEKLRGYIR